MLKEKVQKCIVSHQEKVVGELEKEFQYFKGASVIDADDVRDADSQSHQSQSTLEEEGVSNRLERAKKDLEKIQAISAAPTDIITEGALIETKNLLMYVGIVTSKFTDEGKDIIGISTEAPIFKTLQGQKEGFAFEFAGTDCTILSVK